MSPSPAVPAAARSAADVNEAIRQLVAGGGAGSDEYRELLAEWLRASVVPAA
ncbi:hypothetical protein ACWGDE_01865 [Streptomyces sp. NPDC054956]